jgi:hypothetical protein
LSNRSVILTIHESFINDLDERGTRGRFFATIRQNEERIESPELWTSMASMFSNLTVQRQGLHAHEPVPLAVFVRASVSTSNLEWQRLK